MGQIGRVETNVRELIQKQTEKLAELTDKISIEKEAVLKLEIKLAACKMSIGLLEESLTTKNNGTEKIEQ